MAGKRGGGRAGWQEQEAEGINCELEEVQVLCHPSGTSVLTKVTVERRCHQWVDQNQDSSQKPPLSSPACILLLYSKTTRWGVQTGKISQKQVCVVLNRLLRAVSPGHSVPRDKQSHAQQIGRGSSALIK